ncbi:MAG: flagellar basal body rod protein FlgC [Deltaproteobacteria bacterium]|jgi:flagellar basal-body rod protein FlgC|nr:flagellar basal body rod protein FlgC [Deltaproteobacteria bacterium]NOQ86562.1 flagellar basal body rod protein FlgC [Deltaproteobacteria bacterium]
MDFLTALNISSSALSAQRLRLDVISSNLANINTTNTPEGGPYRRREVVFSSQPVTDNFGEVLNSEMEKNLRKVEVVDVIIDRRPPKMIYDPQHPDANASGYVGMPDINVMEEMVNILSATRSYEANVAVINATKSMAAKALEIGR